MQAAKVSFLGICTHINQVQLPSVPESPVWGHRVVLVNASNPNTINMNSHLSGLGIEPHIARMQISNEEIVSIQGDALFYPYFDTLLLNLDGVTLQILNVAPSGPQALLSDTGCLPNLSTWLPDVAPGPAVTDANRFLASCYFDFYAGTLNGTKLPLEAGGAGVAVLQTETFGDPQLLITPFQGGSPTLVTLRNPNFVNGNRLPAGIVVMNLPVGGDKDNPNDFLLHFLAANGFPPEPVNPPDSLSCPINPDTFNLHAPPTMDIGPGCSNSNIP